MMSEDYPRGPYSLYLDKDWMTSLIEDDISSYHELMEHFKMSFTGESSKMFELHNAAESVYVALVNLRKLCD